MWQTGTLPSDGEPIEVRVLGIYELDEVPRNLLGPFTYEMELLGGGTAEVEYDISLYETMGVEPPQPPAIPESEIKEGSDEWYQLRDSQRHQAAEYHERLRVLAAEEYVNSVGLHVLERCVHEEDRNRISTDEDWDEVLRLGLVPQLTREILARELRSTYQATWSEQEIFDALDKVAGGAGQYNPVRQWEIEWSNSMGLLDEQLAAIPLRERARRVCGFMLTRWFEALESDRIHKKTRLGGAGE